MAAFDGGPEIEQAFIASWDAIERHYIVDFFWGTPEWFNTGFYGSPEWYKLTQMDLERLRGTTELWSSNDRDWLRPIQGLIAEMRRRGYDRKLRAGSSLSSLVLSRSREHLGQPGRECLVITLSPEGGMNVQYWDKSAVSFEIHVDRVDLTPELEQLLDRLLRQPID